MLYKKIYYANRDKWQIVRESGKEPLFQLLESYSEEGDKKVDFSSIDEIAVDDGSLGVDLEDKNDVAVKFGFLGGGQAGGKLCQAFYNLGYRKILAVNTTTQDFEGLEYPNKLLIGGGISGAGKNPAAGRKAAEQERESILRSCREAFGTDVEHIMVAVSSGGGTGSGSCPILVEVAKQYLESIGKAPKVGVIVSLPKKEEGQQVAKNSKDLLDILNAKVDAKEIAPLVLADNAKILKMFPRVSVAKFYDVANKNIASLFNLFNELSSQNSKYQTLDRADYRSVLESGAIVFGLTVLSEPQSETAIAAAVEKNMKKGMLADISIKGATHVGAILVAAESVLNEIPQTALDMSFQTIKRVLGSENILMHSGVYEGPEDQLKDRACVYTMIGTPKVVFDA